MAALLGEDVGETVGMRARLATKVGPATLHTAVSPTWFGELFGRAMACVRTETFNTNLVLGIIDAAGTAGLAFFGPPISSTEFIVEVTAVDTDNDGLLDSEEMLRPNKVNPYENQIDPNTDEPLADDRRAGRTFPGILPHGLRKSVSIGPWPRTVQ